LCRDCIGKCHDLGTDAQPIDIECPECSGVGCHRCHGQPVNGFLRIDGCPNIACHEIAPAAELIDWVKQGHWPIAGGVLDQSAWFVEAARYLKNEDIEAKNG